MSLLGPLTSPRDKREFNPLLMDYGLDYATVTSRSLRSNDQPTSPPTSPIREFSLKPEDSIGGEVRTSARKERELEREREREKGKENEESEESDLTEQEDEDEVEVDVGSEAATRE